MGNPYNGEHNEVNQREVSSDYFKTLQAKLIEGRFFTDEEDASKPLVVVINKAFAKQYFPGEDPVGRKMGDTELSPKSIREIIGVVDDVKEGSLDSEIWPAEYTPINQDNDTYLGLVVRTSQEEKSVLPALGATIHQIDPGIGVLVRCNDDAADQRIADGVSASLVGVAGGWVCGAGFAAGRGGALWRDCVFGEPEDAGDWRADGAGRAAEFGVSDDSEGGRVVDERWDCCRAGLLAWLSATLMRNCCSESARGTVSTLAAVASCWARRRCWRVIFRRAERLR